MSETVIAELLKQKEIETFLDEYFHPEGVSFSITDISGNVLYGTPSSVTASRIPVEVAKTSYGWIFTDESSENIIWAKSAAAYLVQILKTEVEKRDLVDEVHQRYKEISTIHDTARKLSSCTDTIELAEIVLDNLMSQYNTDYAALLLQNKEINTFDVMGFRGNVYENISTIQNPMGAMSAVLSSGQLEYIEDTSANGKFMSVNRKHKVSTVIYAPLCASNKVIGLVDMGCKSITKFSQENLNVIQALCLQASTQIDNIRLHDHLKDTLVDTIRVLADTIEKRDPFTSGHNKRVAKYSLAISIHLNLKPGDLARIKLAALLHDIGKIGIEDRVLRKVGALTDEEFGIIRMHSEIGADILNSVKQLKDIIPAVRNHHERFDGRGYPDGLRGENIPLDARILAVADAFDAMTSKRSYRDALSKEQALAELRRNSGTQFDPEIALAFIAEYKNKPLEEV